MNNHVLFFIVSLFSSVSGFLLSPIQVRPSFLVQRSTVSFSSYDGDDLENSFFSEDNDKDDDEDFDRFLEDEFEKLKRSRDEFQFIFEIDDDLKPTMAHIVLFNPGTDREGVHTIEFPKGSGNNLILAFESRTECEQFSALLKDQNFFDPSVSTTRPNLFMPKDFYSLRLMLCIFFTNIIFEFTQPQEMDLESLEEYCDQIGVKIQVIPKGMNIVPPQETTDNLGLNPNLEKEMAMLNYLFHLSTESNDEDENGRNIQNLGESGAWE